MLYMSMWDVFLMSIKIEQVEKSLYLYLFIIKTILETSLKRFLKNNIFDSLIVNITFFKFLWAGLKSLADSNTAPGS